MVMVDLKPGGEDVPVTEDNKKEYVDCVVEYRISKRVKEQFDAFMSGFSELIPQELITVFDEKELELLIGGMSEIDVYVFPSVTRSRKSLLIPGFAAMTGLNTRTTVVMNKVTKLFSGSGNASARGPQKENPVSYSSQQVHHVYRSTGSRTCKDRMDLDDSQLKSRAIRHSCRRAIHASIGSTYLHIRIMRV